MNFLKYELYIHRKQKNTDCESYRECEIESVYGVVGGVMCVSGRVCQCVCIFVTNYLSVCMVDRGSEPPGPTISGIRRTIYSFKYHHFIMQSRIYPRVTVIYYIMR